MKTKGLTALECREHEDFVIRTAQEICDFFHTPLQGYEFEKVMLWLQKARREGYKEAGQDILKRA